MHTSMHLSMQQTASLRCPSSSRRTCRPAPFVSCQHASQHSRRHGSVHAHAKASEQQYAARSEHEQKQTLVQPAEKVGVLPVFASTCIVVTHASWLQDCSMQVNIQLDLAN